MRPGLSSHEHRHVSRGNQDKGSQLVRDVVWNGCWHREAAPWSLELCWKGWAQDVPLGSRI